MISDIQTVFRHLFRHFSGALARSFRHSDAYFAKVYRARTRTRTHIFLTLFNCLTV